VLVLLLLDLSQDLNVGFGLLEVLTPHSFYIIKLRVSRLSSSLDLGTQILQLSFHSRTLVLHLLASSFQLVLLVPDLHHFTRRTLKVLLQLLKLSSLLEQGFGGSPALVFQNLFAFKVSAFSPLHKLISVVLVPDLQVVECVGKSLDLFFALADLAVKLVSIPLQFFLLLGCFDNKECLGVLAICLDIATGRFIALNEAFVFNSKVLDLLRPDLELDRNFVSLLFSSLLLRFQNILVHLNLLFTFLHGHFQLVLSVFHAVDQVSCHIYCVS
jgi:hypothetical protein